MKRIYSPFKFTAIIAIVFFLTSCNESSGEKSEVVQKSESTTQTQSTGQESNQQTASKGTFPRSGVPTQAEATSPASNSSEEPIQNEIIENRTAATPTSNNSTLRVAGKAIIMYFPTNEDMLNTPETEANAGIVEVLSEFEQEARTFQQNTGINGVQVFWSTDRYVSVQLDNGKSKVFERNMVDRLVGVIFTDGKKEPQEEQSILSADEYRKRARKFFGQ